MLETHGSHLNFLLDIYAAQQHNATVSTILLQENSFKPAFTSGLFFRLAGPARRKIAPCHNDVMSARYTNDICSTRNRYA